MKRIIVVDDDADIAEIINKYLAREGFSVSVFHEADSVLEALEHGLPDMFILDIMMPGMDGLELCKKIRRRGDVPVIFVSARSEEVDRVLGLELGGDDYLTKPFSPGNWWPGYAAYCAGPGPTVQRLKRMKFRWATW